MNHKLHRLTDKSIYASRQNLRIVIMIMMIMIITVPMIDQKYFDVFGPCVYCSICLRYYSLYCMVANFCEADDRTLLLYKWFSLLS